MTKDYSLDITPPNQISEKKYACNDDWTKEFLLRCQVGHVATHWDDQPFITPKLYWYNPENHKIYFHTSYKGRLSANCARDNKVCFEACEIGKILPAKTACNFDLQYESVVVFGKIYLVEDRTEKLYALYGLLTKHFPDMKVGQDYKSIADNELDRTAVYAIRIESWSGKRSWSEESS